MLCSRIILNTNMYFGFRLYSTITKRISIDENLKTHKQTARLLKNVAWYMIKHICLPFVLVSITNNNN